VDGGAALPEAGVTTTSPSWAPHPTVEVRAVSKWFGQKVAVSDLTCAFGPGVTGLLGPNGAGKTTLLRMLVGLLSPSDGEISILGKDPRHNPDVYRSLAMVPEEDAVYGFQTARQFAGYAAVLSGAGPEAVERAIAIVELGDAADRPISGFSKGMRQRAKVAAALVLDAPILVLDEPLNGTDPVQRAHLIATFRRLAAEGRTVVVSSHVLAEVERMADRVLAIVDGKLAAAGDVAAIRQAMTDIPYRVRLEADDARRLAAALIGSETVQAVTVQGRVLTVETGDLAGLGRTIAPLARSLGLRLSLFEPEDLSLESVFRYLVRGR
jgi:ABC-2 type transport system ATP-binding protein